MSTSESYPGQNILISYIKERKGKSSYRGFLNLHRDVIVFIISSKDWRDIDTSWARRFLEEAKELLNQTIFLALKEKVKTERSQHAEVLQTYWQGVIEERKKDPIKRKRTITENDEKENLEPPPRKRPKSIITLICLVKGNTIANAFPVDIDKDQLVGHLKKVIKVEQPQTFANVDAKDIKLWKVEIPDDQLRNLSLPDQNALLPTRKISKYFSATPAEQHVHIIVSPPESTLRNCINGLLHGHNIDKLCLYIEPKLKELIKKGNLYDDRELVIKVIFHVLLLDNITNHLVDTEVPIKVYRKEVKKSDTLYADLLIVEVEPADNAKRNRFIFEFKSKGANFLDLQIGGIKSNWDVMERKAKNVETMSRKEVLQLKCNNSEKFDNGKTMREIFNGACEQLLNYVCNLKDDDRQNHREFITSAFVVMAVGSRKLLWKKIGLI